MHAHCFSRTCLRLAAAAFAALGFHTAATAQTFTEYTIPTTIVTPNANSITPGPDGALWFTKSGGNRIGRITTGGTITEFAIPTSNAFPFTITAGPDGALWFTEQDLNATKIGRITTAGAITEFPVPTASSQPTGIAAGSDGALWFTEDGAATRSAGSHRRHGHRIHLPGSPGRTVTRSGSRRGRTARCGSPNSGTSDRADHDRRHCHQLRGSHRNSGASRYRGRGQTARCGSPRAPAARSGGSRPAGRDRVRAPTATATRTGSRRGRTARCGSPRAISARSAVFRPRGRLRSSGARAAGVRRAARLAVPTAICGSPTASRS